MLRVNLETGHVEAVALPDFLIGLSYESLVDLSWTDPALGVQGFGWFSEHQQHPEYNSDTHKIGEKHYQFDAEKQIVIATFDIVELSEDEIKQRTAQANQFRITQINQRLTQIDIDSVRPLRALTSGNATDFDKQKLSKLDAEANELRDELKALLA